MFEIVLFPWIVFVPVAAVVLFALLAGSGRQVDPPRETELKCRSCAAKLPAQAKFCPQCGKPIHGGLGQSQRWS
jgi:zinc-ribbon domain